MAGSKKIGRYQIAEALGVGGMARVYRAYDPRFKRAVALKVMSVSLLDDATLRQRFNREAEVIASLEHRAIVPVYDFGEEDGRPFLVMRLMTGGSLADRLRRGPQSPATIQRVLDRIGDALDKSHDRGIIHRDLKPGNILFDDDNQPYLSDFGIVKSASASTKLTATGGLIGTPAYMSPEQVMGTAEIDGRSDLYALGAVLYEMLTGRQPYDSETGMGMAMAHLTQPVPQLADINPSVAAYQGVIDRAMAKAPQDRYQRGEQLAAGFRHPPAAMETNATVIEDADNRTVIESPAAPAPRQATTVPAASTSSSRRGIPWKYIAPVLLLLLVAFAALMMRDTFLPQDFEAAEATAPPKTVSSAFEALVATTTAQAEEAALAALSGTAQAEARAAISVELTLTATHAATAEPPAAVPQAAQDDSNSVSDPAADRPTSTATSSATATATPTSSATPTPTATNTPELDFGPERTRIGRTAGGRDIEVVRIGAGAKAVVLIGGLHAGFAPATVVIGDNMVRHFSDNPHEIPAEITLYIVPNVNQDSTYAPGEWEGRANDHDVDLNRNWDCNWQRDATWRGAEVNDSGGPAPFSEPETQALRDLFFEIDPVTVIIWEARFKDGLISPGSCGAVSNTTRDSYALSGVFGLAAGYRVDDYEAEANQVINGDANNWLDSVGIPSFAVLLDQYEEADWANNLAGTKAVLAYHAE